MPATREWIHSHIAWQNERKEIACRMSEDKRDSSTVREKRLRNPIISFSLFLTILIKCSIPSRISWAFQSPCDLSLIFISLIYISTIENINGLKIHVINWLNNVYNHCNGYFICAKYINVAINNTIDNFSIKSNEIWL